MGICDHVKLNATIQYSGVFSIRFCSNHNLATALSRNQVYQASPCTGIVQALPSSELVSVVGQYKGSSLTVTASSSCTPTHQAYCTTRVLPEMFRPSPSFRLLVI